MSEATFPVPECAFVPEIQKTAGKGNNELQKLLTCSLPPPAPIHILVNLAIVMA